MSSSGGRGELEEAERLHGIGRDLAERGERSAAEDAFRAALALDPNRPATLNNLANLRREAGDLPGAMNLYDEAYRRGGRSAALLTNAAKNALALGRADDAERLAKEAIARFPERAASYCLLASALSIWRRTAEAVQLLEAAAEQLPASPEVWNALGVARDRALDAGGALTAFRTAAALAPGDPRVLANYGDAARRTKRYDEARAALERALALEPSFVDALESLAALALELGACDEAASLARRAEQHSDAAHRLSIGSMRLFAMSHSDAVDARALHDAHVAWGHDAVQAELPRAVSPEPPERSRLKLVYLSPDFRDHVVTRFLEPILEAHDARVVDVVLASATRQPDEVTARLRERHSWVELAGSTAEDARALLVALDPDVIIDLAGHTSDSVLPLLSPRIAPLQATWLGYPGTSGLSTIDLRITDEWCDPPGSEADFTERLLRLERTAWVYRPSDLPDIEQGRHEEVATITFGCLNRASKLSRTTLEMFASVLGRVEGARLVLRPRAVDQALRARVRTIFGDAAARVVLLDEAAAFMEALRTYDGVDVALDTFPYQGTTTTCDALVMGVPVVSRIGPWPASRVSRSLLHAVGLDDLVCTTAEQFVEVAVELARDRRRRAELRATLRSRVLGGPLGDPTGLARGIERGLIRARKLAAKSGI